MRQLFLLMAVVFALAGCDGSSNGLPTPGNVPPGALSTPRIEAVLRNDSTVFQDPQNIQVGDEVFFQLVNYSLSGDDLVRHILPASGWRTSDTNNRFGNLADNGLFIAGDRETTDRQIVAATYNGQEYSAFYHVRPREVRLLGYILDDEGFPVLNAKIEFYNAQDIKVTEVRSAFDGSFRASVPPFDTYMTVAPESLTDDYYRVFEFLGSTYTAGDMNCRATVSGQEIGVRQMEGDIVLVRVVPGQPAPFADGCAP